MIPLPNPLRSAALSIFKSVDKMLSSVDASNGLVGIDEFHDPIRLSDLSVHAPESDLIGVVFQFGSSACKSPQSRLTRYRREYIEMPFPLLSSSWIDGCQPHDRLRSARPAYSPALRIVTIEAASDRLSLVEPRTDWSPLLAHPTPRHFDLAISSFLFLLAINGRTHPYY